jgi:hypothetical protein
VPGPGEIPNIKAATDKDRNVAKSIQRTLNFSNLVNNY